MAALAYNDAPRGHTPLSPLVTYAEFRSWARWLGMFTASDLADSMAVSVDVAERGINALLWHGLIEETGQWLDGPVGEEQLVEYKDPRLLPGPKHHPVGQSPESIAVSQMGGWLLYDVRGLPVRIRTERDNRKILSTAGARSHHVQRERAYERQMEAKMAAAEAARRKKQREMENGGPKWKRKKKKSVSVAGLY